MAEAKTLLTRREMLRQTAAGLCTASLATGPKASSAEPQSEFPKLLWTVDLASISYGGGAIGELNGERAIVFGTYYNDEHLYAIRAKDGKVLWKFKSEGGPFDASVALVDLNGDGKPEVLAADSSTGTLFCLDGAGKSIWKKALPNSTDSPPAVADLAGDGKLAIVVGTMMLGDGHGRVIAIEAVSQKDRWMAKIPGHIQSEPALIDLDGDKVLDVLVTTWRGDKRVHALSGKDGSELWTYKMAGDMYHGVSAFDHQGVHIVAASIEGDVALLDAKGKAVWAQKVGGYLFAPTAVADLDGDGSPEIVVCSGSVHILGIDGKEKWRTPDFGSVARGVAIVDADGDGRPDLLFGASDRKFRAVQGRTGKEIWTFDATVKGEVYETIDSGPVAADFDGDGNLDVFFVVGKGTSDKTQKENYGRAYAIRAGKGKGSWNMFRGNLRRTGSA
jgi:outer membrane protein assembly factor BamB